MTADSPKRKPPTPAEAQERLNKLHGAVTPASKKLPQTAATLPAKVTHAKSTAIAVPDTRDSVTRYLDDVAPGGIVGRRTKFGKDGTFVTADDDEPIPEGTVFTALCDQTLIGWLKFNDEGPPEQVMGLLYDGFVMPPRDSLSDLDPAGWSAGLDGCPADPWQHHIYLVLQHADTAELYTFTTQSRTGRRAVGNLLRHYDRMRKHNPGELPVIKLKVGGFQHKDDRIGWVPTPVFAVVGRAPSDSVTRPDTSTAGDMDDQIPF